MSISTSRNIVIYCLFFLVIHCNYSLAQIAQNHSFRYINSGGDELVIGLDNPPAQYNPVFQPGILTGIIGAQIYAGLIRVDSNLAIKPYLAKSWKVTNSNQKVTFELVRNAFFHDGFPINSEDVAFSIKVVKKYHPFNSMLANLKSIEMNGPYSLTITFLKPHPVILRVFSSVLIPILPKHAYKSVDDVLGNPLNMRPIGSGPFKVHECEPLRWLSLERFDKFFMKSKPRLKRLTFVFFNDPEELDIALEQGEIHMVCFSPLVSRHNELEKLKHLNVTYRGFKGIGAMIGLGLNLAKKPFDDIRVRKALTYAIDKKFIAQEVMGRKGKIMNGPLVPFSQFYKESHKYEFDTYIANKLLDEAGYRRGHDGRRFTIQVDYPPNAASVARPLLVYLRHKLSRTVGIDLLIRDNHTFQKWVDLIVKGNYQATIEIAFTWSDPIIGVHGMYDSKNRGKGVMWSNTLNYKNNNIDDIIEKASSDINFDNRKKLYDKFQRIIASDLPVIWLSTVPYATIYNSNLSGINDSMWGMLSPILDVHFVNRRNR